MTVGRRGTRLDGPSRRFCTANQRRIGAKSLKPGGLEICTDPVPSPCAEPWTHPPHALLAAFTTHNPHRPYSNRPRRERRTTQRNAGRGSSRAQPACALQKWSTWISRYEPAIPSHIGRIAEHHDAHHAASRSGSLSREIQAKSYFAVGAGWAEARLRPPLPLLFFAVAAAAGPLAFFRALRLACSAAFASPA